jgi:hypothetical protein
VPEEEVIFIDFSKLSQSGKARAGMPGNRMRNRLLTLATVCLQNYRFYRQKPAGFRVNQRCPVAAQYCTRKVPDRRFSANKAQRYSASPSGAKVI